MNIELLKNRDVTFYVVYIEGYIGWGIIGIIRIRNPWFLYKGYLEKAGNSMVLLPAFLMSSEICAHFFDSMT